MSSDDDVECVEVRTTRKKPPLQSRQRLGKKESSSDEALSVSTSSDESDASSNSGVSKSAQNEEPIPSGPECLSRCAQFAEITSTDKALAMFYLQDTNWNLQVKSNFVTMAERTV